MAVLLLLLQRTEDDTIWTNIRTRHDTQHTDGDNNLARGNKREDELREGIKPRRPGSA